MLPDEASHASHVEAWLNGVAKDLPAAQLLTLFERALDALWQRVQITLGEVTLTAIVDRVIYTTSETYPFLSTLKIEGNGIRFDEFRQQGATHHHHHLPEVVRFVLVELLTVLGNLTDEILTPTLHAELARVALEKRAGKQTQTEPGVTEGDDDDARASKP